MKTFLFITYFVLFSANISAQNTNNLENANKLFDEEKYDEAKNMVEIIVDNNDKNHEAYFLLGKINFVLKDYDEASENFEEAIELKDENADYHFWLGQSYSMEAQTANIFSQTMLASDIIEEFERTVELDSTHIQGRIGVVNFHLVAPGIVGGDIKKAEHHANKLLTLNEVKGRTALANIYLKQEKMDLVETQIKILEEKYATDKSLSQLYNSLGYYYLGINKFSEAITAFEKQVKVNPESANSYDSLGDGYKAAGKYSEAIAQYRKALEINPSFSASIKNLEELERKKVE